MGRRMEPQEAMGLALRTLRLERGLSQAEVTDRADVARSWLSQMESGRSNPAWGSLIRLAGALDVSPVELVERAEQIRGGDWDVDPQPRRRSA
ncbi:MAG TPA: helix-turn-helix transcriptional regulator [Solirubrobacteraceae bacterium]|nr:helix-turn-helix transcriptional regulator [Solirubrobacteraceae bacterium]